MGINPPLHLTHLAPRLTEFQAPPLTPDISPSPRQESANRHAHQYTPSVATKPKPNSAQDVPTRSPFAENTGLGGKKRSITLISCEAKSAWWKNPRPRTTNMAWQIFLDSRDFHGDARLARKTLVRNYFGRRHALLIKTALGSQIGDGAQRSASGMGGVSVNLACWAGNQSYSCLVGFRNSLHSTLSEPFKNGFMVDKSR